jgi:hypothetical protein
MTSSTPGRPDPVTEPDPVRQLVRLFATQLLAVIAVATVIAVVFTLAGRGTGPDVAADDGSNDSASPTPSATSAPPAPSPSKSSAPATTPPASSSAPATTTSTGPEVVKVDVLNQSAGNGSAERVATDLRDAGWKIGRIDDFNGNVSTTTVYWLSPENRRQARQISRFLGGVRVQEGFDTLVDGRVSIVLVESR